MLHKDMFYILFQKILQAALMWSSKQTKETKLVYLLLF